MRIVFAGGGTGGHIFPNIAVIKKLSEVKVKEKPQIFYIGERGGSMEEKIVAGIGGVSFFGIHAGKMRRYFDLENFVDAFKVPVGFFEALYFLRRIRPDFVFAKGGYVCVPVVFAARVLNIPVWLHESDVSPGLSTKICSRFAGRIFLSFKESEKFFLNAKAKISVVGNPIRERITKGTKKAGYEFTGFSQDKPVVMIVGGSIGAQSLNKLVYKILPELIKRAQVIHITGKSGAGAKIKNKFGKSYKVFEFLDEKLAHCYAISDLMVSRAGSGSIFEILACKKPMILVPLSASASRGDQMENAEVCEKNGWAKMLDQDSLTPEIFLREITAFLESEPLRASMIENQKKASDFVFAAERIAGAYYEKENLQ